MRTREQIAISALECATSWDPNTCLLGNTTAREVVFLAAFHIDTCPACGSTSWVNIDCVLCQVVDSVCRQREGKDEAK